MPTTINKTTNDFYYALMMKESSGNAHVLNKFGFAGLFQMGEMALDDAGYYDSRDGTTGINDWRGTWKGKDGIYSLDGFLNDPQVQINAIISYHKVIWDHYLKNYHNYDGRIINGIKITKSGMIAAAHLVGHNDLKKFLTSDGKDMSQDGNGVFCTKYLKDFSGYDIDFSQKLKLDNLINKDNAADNGFDFVKDSKEQLAKIFDIFDEPEVRSQDLDNVQRFRIIAEKQRAGGNEEFAGIFAGMADSTDAVLSFLGKSLEDEL